MGFFDRLKSEFIDVIEWTDSTDNTMIYRFERYGNEIKNGAKLIVRPGQVAVLVNEGRMPADVFTAGGSYELSTRNIPIMTTLNSWSHGFKSPFKAEVYFFNMKEFLKMPWGLKNPIIVDDPRFGMIELRGFGTYAFRFNDPKLFLEKFSSTDGFYTTDQIKDHLRSLIVMLLSDKLGESAIPVEKLAGNMIELSALALEQFNPIFENDFGLNLCKFYIENLSMPDEVKKEIMNYSRLGKIDSQQLAQFNMAQSLKNQDGGGTGGSMAGMIVGMNIANKMMTPENNSQNPPPIVPNLVQSFHVAVNGKQQGPFDISTLQSMVLSGQLESKSLVWKNGMSSWMAAGEVLELNHLFINTPPPLPL